MIARARFVSACSFTWGLPGALDAVAQMRHGGRLDDPRALELHRPSAIVEQADTAAEEDRSDMQLNPVEQPGLKVLLSDVGSARDLNVLLAGRLARRLQRSLDAVGHEG